MRASEIVDYLQDLIDEHGDTCVSVRPLGDMWAPRKNVVDLESLTLGFSHTAPEFVLIYHED